MYSHCTWQRLGAWQTKRCEGVEPAAVAFLQPPGTINGRAEKKIPHTEEGIVYSISAGVLRKRRKSLIMPMPVSCVPNLRLLVYHAPNKKSKKSLKCCFSIGQTMYSPIGWTRCPLIGPFDCSIGQAGCNTIGQTTSSPIERTSWSAIGWTSSSQNRHAGCSPIGKAGYSPIGPTSCPLIGQTDWINQLLSDRTDRLLSD